MRLIEVARDRAEDLFWGSACLVALVVAFVFAKLFITLPRRRR